MRACVGEVRSGAWVGWWGVCVEYSLVVRDERSRRMGWRMLVMLVLVGGGVLGCGGWWWRWKRWRMVVVIGVALGSYYVIKIVTSRAKKFDSITSALNNSNVLDFKVVLLSARMSLGMRYGNIIYNTQWPGISEW